MRCLETASVFRKQLKLMLKRGKSESEIKTVIVMLANDELLRKRPTVPHFIRT